MKRTLQFVFFVHSLQSDWNNGNAHFLRGLVRALGRMGHRVTCFEPVAGWSRQNLLAVEPQAEQALRQFDLVYPELQIGKYDPADMLSTAGEALRSADVVVVHEWNEPALVDAVLQARDEYGFRALFHDTHHRASSSPQALSALQVPRFNGVLAFGEVLRAIYADRWGMNRVWTLHEAADTTVFKPIQVAKTTDVVWVGNWGDDERTRELNEFLMVPARSLPRAKFVVHGVRYPEEGLSQLSAAGVEFAGYLPNLEAPCTYAAARVTLHVPRQQYAAMLTGIPTIRVFEALACGIPLVSAPWKDTESLFRPEDFVRVRNSAEMTAAISALLADDAMRRQQALAGLETILARHTCRHRAEQLTDICEELLA